VSQIALPRDDAPSWHLYGAIVRELSAAIGIPVNVEVKIVSDGHVTAGKSLSAAQSAFRDQVAECRAAGTRTPVVDEVLVRLWNEATRVDGVLYTKEQSHARPHVRIESEDPRVSERACSALGGVVWKAAQRYPRRRRLLQAAAVMTAIAAFARLLTTQIVADVAESRIWPLHREAAPVAGAARPVYAAYGEPAEDGMFRYTVRAAGCAAGQSGVAGARRHCVIAFRVRNLRADPALPRGPFEVVARDGQRFAAVATGRAFGHNVYPGHESDGTLAFDLPAGSSFEVNVTSAPGSQLLVFDGERPEAPTPPPPSAKAAP
jgi:hypothetical protein